MNAFIIFIKATKSEEPSGKVISRAFIETLDLLDCRPSLAKFKHSEKNELELLKPSFANLKKKSLGNG